MAGYTVYEHIDPDTGECLYVGSGRGSRCYELECGGVEARPGDKRSPAHAAHMARLLRNGWRPHELVYVRITGLSKEAARGIEALLIRDRKPAYNILHNPGRARKTRQNITAALCESVRAMRAAGAGLVETGHKHDISHMTVHRIEQGSPRAAQLRKVPVEKWKPYPSANDNAPAAITEVA